MPDEGGVSLVSLHDLVGLTKPLTKLIEVVAAGMGNVYRPMGIFRDGKAEAARIRMLASADADAQREFDRLQKERQLTELEVVPDLRKRAELRQAAEAAAEQENLERIAAKATKYIREAVSDEQVDEDWRTLFFNNARNVSDETMREVWAQVLAGEVSMPGSFGFRTLETLRLMARTEAEAFQRLCNLVFEPDYVVRLHGGLDRFGISFKDILALQAAGLLQESHSLEKQFPRMDSGVKSGLCLAVTHNVGLQLAFNRQVQIPAYMLTMVGRELRRLVASSANAEYITAVEQTCRLAGLSVVRIPIQREGDLIKLLNDQVLRSDDL